MIKTILLLLIWILFNFLLMLVLGLAFSNPSIPILFLPLTALGVAVIFLTKE